MKKVISVSLGSSKRDHEVQVPILGEDFLIARRGTDGDFEAAVKLLGELDGEVDAIGLGGIDIYLYSLKNRYVLKEGLRLKQAVKRTPVVDGSGLKNTLEREVIGQLAEDPRFALEGKKVLMVSGLDRFGMAQAFVQAGCRMIYGDFLFSIGLAKPLYTLEELEHYADKLLPLITELPIEFIYPTGKSQDKKDARPAPFGDYYREADIVAGDFHYIYKYMPSELPGKTVVTNTVTRENLKELAQSGVKYLITTTPEFSGRSFGTNVLEGVLLAILRKTPEEISPEDYLKLIKELDLKPRIEILN